MSSAYPGLFDDLAGDSLLHLQAGERLWKLYFLRPAWGRDQHVEHRIYTKEQADGRITLLSYTLSMPDGSETVRGNMAVARDIPKDTLNQVIWNVVRQSQLSPEELEVIDLSVCATFADQLQRLRALASAKSLEH